MLPHAASCIFLCSVLCRARCTRISTAPHHGLQEAAYAGSRRVRESVDKKMKSHLASEAVAMHHVGSMWLPTVFIVGPRDPEILKRGQRCQDGAPNPRGVLALSGGKDFNLLCRRQVDKFLQHLQQQTNWQSGAASRLIAKRGEPLHCRGRDCGESGGKGVGAEFAVTWVE